MLAEELLALTLKKGISTAEVYQVNSYARPFSFEANRLKQIESSRTSGIALRLWHNGCPGLVVAYGHFNPEDLIAKAIAVSQLNEPEEVFLNDRAKLLYLDDSTEPDVKLLITQGQNAIEQIISQYPDVIVNLDLEWETETTTLINSNGLYCQQTDNSYSASLGVELVREEDFLGIYDGVYSHQPVNLTPTIETIMKKLQWAKKNVPLQKGKMPVLFTPNAVVTLWETVCEALNGKKILDKSSPWSEYLGKAVIASCLNLRQLPDLKPYHCPFDDEGTITQSINLIENGNLTSFYTDKKTAQKLGITNTGNGFRPSLGNYPTPDLINLVVDKGNYSFEELVKKMENGIIIDQILGSGGDISGDFSFNIDLGYRVQQGEIVGRVKDTMTAGNVYQALQNVSLLGFERIWSGSCYTPSVVIEELSVISG